MKIYSWNVNGIRAVSKKGFWDWFKEIDADIVCLQEVKAFKEQAEKEFDLPENYYDYWHNGTRKGYSGVLTLSKKEAKNINHEFTEPVEIFNTDGRIIETEFDDFVLLNIYFPNGNPKANGDEMLSHKLKFYESFLNYVNALKAEGKSIIACGDYNIVHTEIDIARPKENQKSIGFLPEERAWISKIIENGYIDVFRHFNPDLLDKYTWWSYRAGARQRNVGWRIDYFFVTEDLVDRIKDVGHKDDVLGSDHCPLYIEID